ncbi:MAG: hypothetical protein ACKVIN_09020 [Longimicrobiales bacterium]
MVEDAGFGLAACGVGVGIGIAVTRLNRKIGQPLSVVTMCSALATIAAVPGGRFLLVHLENPTDREILEMFVNDFDSEEFVISCVAADVANEFADAGSDLVWPGIDPGNAVEEAHFPPSVWAEAEARWAIWDYRRRGLYTRERRSGVKFSAEANIKGIRASMTAGSFTESFSP